MSHGQSGHGFAGDFGSVLHPPLRHIPKMPPHPYGSKAWDGWDTLKRGNKRKDKIKGSHVKAREEEKEIVKRALAMLHSGRILDQPTRVGGPDIDDTHDDGSRVTPEALAASVLAENTSEEVDRILKVWSELFGMRLDHETVRKQLVAIRKWQSQWTSIRDRTTKV